MKTKALLLCLSTSIFLPACGAGSPEAFAEKSFKISCQHIEECNPEAFTAAGYESANDCRDKLLDMPVDDGQTLRDSIADSCPDYDRGAARKCLAAYRKAKGDCSMEILQVDEPACEDVCPDSNMAGLEYDGNPFNGELVAQVLEEMEANGELDLDPEDELKTVQ